MHAVVIVLVCILMWCVLNSGIKKIEPEKRQDQVEVKQPEEKRVRRIPSIGR